MWHFSWTNSPLRSSFLGALTHVRVGNCPTIRFSYVDPKSSAQLPMWNNSWKAVLKPTKAGGDYTIMAKCIGCGAAPAATTLAHITFGDMWYCTGQSNMWLPVQYSFSRNVRSPTCTLVVLNCRPEPITVGRDAWVHSFARLPHFPRAGIRQGHRRREV